MIVLDCTIRDGGYYNQWNFDIDLVNLYIQQIEKSKINAIEIGFRTIENKSKGLFYNTTDSLIEKLYIPNIDYFGVMINASDFKNNHVGEAFVYKDLSSINLVRVATHFKDISISEIICKDLKYLGYTVCLNLMQVADKSYDEIKNISKKIQQLSRYVDVLYLADSLGGMNSDSVDYAFKAIKSEWIGNIGFHGHNNKAQALNNSLEAVDIGFDWVDCTILGMGRGAGNTETEYLLGELNKRGYGEFNVDVIYDFALSKFTHLKDQYKWGSSLPYYLAAEFGIHPTYIQTLISKNVSNDLILKSVYYLKDKISNSFNEELLMESLK